MKILLLKSHLCLFEDGVTSSPVVLLALRVDRPDLTSVLSCRQGKLRLLDRFILEVSGGGNAVDVGGRADEDTVAVGGLAEGDAGRARGHGRRRRSRAGSRTRSGAEHAVAAPGALAPAGLAAAGRLQVAEGVPVRVDADALGLPRARGGGGLRVALALAIGHAFRAELPADGLGVLAVGGQLLPLAGRVGGGGEEQQRGR